MGSMAFAGFIMLFFAALGQGLLYTMEQNAIGVSTGDIQIHAPGYRNDPDLYARVPDPAALVDKLALTGLHAAPRLYGFGLAAAGGTSSGIWMRGVDLVNEPKVTVIDRQVMEGDWLSADKPKEVVIGKKLARTLGVKPGGEIVVISQASDGALANDIYFVRGILKSVGDAVDQGGFLMVDAEFRRLMGVPEGAHEIAVVRINKDRALAEAAEAVAALAPGMEVKDWRQLQPVLAKMIDVMDISLLFMLFIAYSAVGMVILNAMLMNVFERIREFGVMKAIGVTPSQVFWLIVAEAMLEAVIANVVALGFGIPVVRHFEVHGIDLSSLSSGASLAGIAFDPIWYCKLTTKALAMPVWFMFIVVLAAVIYPALKAALLKPLEALHHQ
ncbi:MAG: ABC transporter permease [Nitrospinae bacterium]|nr:ABC transporter permease [Nitrospinota bacterium]